MLYHLLDGNEVVARKLDRLGRNTATCWPSLDDLERRAWEHAGRGRASERSCPPLPPERLIPDTNSRLGLSAKGLPPRNLTYAGQPKAGHRLTARVLICPRRWRPLREGPVSMVAGPRHNHIPCFVTGY